MEKWHAPSTGTVPKLFFLVVIKIIIKRFLYMLTKLAEKEDEFSTFSGQEMYHKKLTIFKFPLLKTLYYGCIQVLLNINTMFNVL